jgi:predicted nucleic acid-binding Zn ribbon protein
MDAFETTPYAGCEEALTFIEKRIRALRIMYWVMLILMIGLVVTTATMLHFKEILPGITVLVTGVPLAYTVQGRKEKHLLAMEILRMRLKNDVFGSIAEARSKPNPEEELEKTTIDFILQAMIIEEKR